MTYVNDSDSYTYLYHSVPPNSNTVAETLVAPAFIIDKYVDAFTVAANDEITYTITVQNVGLGLAQNIQITDNLPANMSFTSGSATLNGNPLADPVAGVWDLSGHDLAGGEEHTITFQAQVDSRGAGFTHSFLHNLPVLGNGRYQSIVQDDLGQTISQGNGRFTTVPDFTMSIMMPP